MVAGAVAGSGWFGFCAKPPGGVGWLPTGSASGRVWSPGPFVGWAAAGALAAGELAGAWQLQGCR